MRPTAPSQQPAMIGCPPCDAQLFGPVLPGIFSTDIAPDLLKCAAHSLIRERDTAAGTGATSTSPAWPAPPCQACSDIGHL